MKKTVVFVISIFVVTTGFSESFVLNNQTSVPTDKQKSKVAIQWAASAKEVDESNNRIRQGLRLNPDKLHLLTKRGKIHLSIPKKAEYFRVMVWSKGELGPDFLTNWVDIIPNKIYTLNKDHLIPTILMAGTGC